MEACIILNTSLSHHFNRTRRLRKSDLTCLRFEPARAVLIGQSRFCDKSARLSAVVLNATKIGTVPGEWLRSLIGDQRRRQFWPKPPRRFLRNWVSHSASILSGCDVSLRVLLGDCYCNDKLIAKSQSGL